MPAPSFADRAKTAQVQTTITKPAGVGKAPPPREIKASNAPAAGKYSGMRGAQPRYPLITDCELDLEVIKTYESKNPKTGAWYHADFKILVSNQPDDSPLAAGKFCTFLKSVSDKAIETTGPMVVAFTVAAAGFDNDDDFFADFDGRDEEHPLADDLLNAASGAPSPVAANPLAGCKVHVIGYPDGVGNNGTQYYGATWSPYVEPTA